MFASFLNRRNIIKCDEPAPAGDAAAPPPQGPPEPQGCMQFENFPKEWNDMIRQDNFDGFRLDGGKHVCKNLQATHHLFLGTTLGQKPYLYQFGPMFHDPLLGLTMMGRMGLDGGLTMGLFQQIGEKAMLKFNAQSMVNATQPGQNMIEICGDYAAKDWSAALKMVYHGSPILNGFFAQQVTKNLHLGGEMIWVLGQNVSIGSIGARYVADKNVITAQVSRSPPQPQGPMMGPMDPSAQTQGLKVQYLRKVSDRLSLGAEYEINEQKTSSCRLAYEYLFRNGRVQGALDTAGQVSCVVQDFMGFGLSGMIDYVNDQYKFGFMMHMMPPPEDQPAP